MRNLSVSKNKQSLVPRNLVRLMILLLILLSISVIASLVFGSRMITWTQLLDGLFHSEVESHEASVVRQRVVRCDTFHYKCLVHEM